MAEALTDLARCVVEECDCACPDAAALLLHASTYSENPELRARAAAALVPLHPRWAVWNGSRAERLAREQGAA